MDIKKALQEQEIKPDPLKDQFFLTDAEIIKKTVKLAELSKNDIVLEIGAGIGNITREIAKYAGAVIALEIDKRLKPFLSGLPQNVEFHFEDAHKFVSQAGKYNHKKKFNKIVANIPFSIAEWLLHNLTFIEYDKVILVVAKKFFYSASENPVFSSFYKIEEKFEIPKEKFYPVPRTNSVVIDLKKLADPAKTKNLGLFLRQFLYKNEGWKVKNSLREGLIKYVWLTEKRRLTKKQAREVIQKADLPQGLLEKPPDSKKIYDLTSSISF